MANVSSVTKFFPVPKEGFTTTVASTIGSGAATVPLNSVTGYTNGDTVVMVIEPANSTNKQAFTGVIDTAGVQVTGVVWTEGTNTSHAAGSTVVDYVAATHMAMVTKGLLRDHNPSGYHKSLNDNNAAVWIGQTATASAVNQITVANNATNLPPKISATGSDTNIDLQIVGKGTGKAHVDGFSEIGFDFIVGASGTWSGDAYASTRAASMTLLICYINGQRGSIAAVTARVFTASVDTYIDVLNTSGVFTLVYTEVANNAASPALAANSLRLGVIVTGATNIAAVGSVNQGQESKVLPIASSIPYSVTDSLGNLISPRDPMRKLLGYRQNIASFTTTSTTMVDITSLNFVANIPAGRKVKVSIDIPQVSTNAAAVNSYQIVDVTASANVLTPNMNPGNTTAQPLYNEATFTPPASGARNYKIQVQTNTGTYNTGSSNQATAAVLKLELA